MSQSEYSHSIPSDFSRRVIQLLKQHFQNEKSSEAFLRCSCEFNDLGLAYYVGMRGDNWNMNAIDLTLEGASEDISTLKDCDATLRKAISTALKRSTTGLLLHDIYYLAANNTDALPASNDQRLNEVIETSHSVLKNIIVVAERLSANSLYSWQTTEDKINDYVRDLLTVMGYNELKDQTRHGLAATGNNAGEVDLLISKHGHEVAVIEALKLSSINAAYIDQHINKALLNYNPLGTPTFLIAYVSTTNFESFWEKYVQHITRHNYQLETLQGVRVETHPNAATRIASAVLSKDDFAFPVYFVAIKLAK